jgi:GNAT superfamily N-acetyltransferase
MAVAASIERVSELAAGCLDALLAESEQAGSPIVRRLVDEWASGANRFDRSGEALFAARIDGRLVGVCGLNVDPYSAEPRLGRVRHLYVLSAYRRHGIGRQLVARVVATAQGRFDRLRLSTGNPVAARFYERTGFRSDEAAHCTHVMSVPAPSGAGSGSEG